MIEQLHDAVFRDMFLVGLGTLLRWTSRSMTPHDHRTNELWGPLTTPNRNFEN